MRTINLIGLFLIAVILSSCSQSKEKMIKEIAEKEKSLYNNTTGLPDKAKSDEIVAMYMKFAEQYPQDSLTPSYIYAAANLQMNMSQNEEAIAKLDKIINNYPDYPRLADVFFLKAFIYDNNIKNLNKARQAYTDFLNKFPDSDLADDAKMSLDNLGKTPEQIVKEFEQKMKEKADSATAATDKK